MIRPATEADLPALTSLMAELGYPISDCDMRGNLRAVRASREDEILAAEFDRQVVGLIGVRTALAIHRVGRVGEISSLVVSASHRRHGIGRALVAAAEEWLRARDVTNVRVASNNRRREEAHPFYASLGYESTHTMFRKELATPSG